MSPLPPSIPKQPALKPAEDYYRLRREGIGFIAQMGSHLWTDYNTHDPGITILEALCYAITDLSHRTSWEIKDILSPATPSKNKSEPFPNQAFFPAREILTVNPSTPDDFRRLLIDLDGVRNAWIFCKECACDFHYYAWCEKDQLMLSYQRPSNLPVVSPKTIDLHGMYDILLELEADPELGDLNDRKIVQTFSISFAGSLHAYTLELRFPAWELLDQEDYNTFTSSTGNPTIISWGKFSRSKTDNNTISDAELKQYWRGVFYLTFSVSIGSEIVKINNATLRIFCDVETKNNLSVGKLELKLAEETATGFIQGYRRKLQKTAAQVRAAKCALNSHRNLDEDYCRVKVVDVEDIAVCADVEVAADADIERVQARIWFEIEQYLNPPVPFYTLQELLDANTPVEDIFNGPALSSGFIKAKELEASGLKTMLRTSDIVNRLMRIKGVIAVNNLLLTKYDAEGNVIKGAADPHITPIDANKVSASWLLAVTQSHQPRLYHNLSRFLFYKNGLPFLPRMDEAYDTLTQLHGEAERPRIKSAPKDLPVPPGTFRNLEEYFPVQYSFPLTYGIGPDGLPSHASTLRRAQAMQLKAYLMVFEQHLGNALAQLAHTADLFSLDPKVERTYFIREFNDAIIQGYDQITKRLDTKGLDQTKLKEMTETDLEFQQRRNRFLDHLMARFGEQFSEYALMLSNLAGKQVAADRLITDKISFLKDYPNISHDRAKAFDYTQIPCTPDNIPGIKKRISLLLGYPDLKFVWPPINHPVGKFKLTDSNERIFWLEGDITPDVANQIDAYWMLIKRMALPEAYKIVKYAKKYHLHLKDKKAELLADHQFEGKAEAQAMMDELLAWSANERFIVVEHLLLRPKFPGDALYPACADGVCVACGDEVPYADPYSFRLTFVMPAWANVYADNLDMRRFAERTIQQETPSHLLGKICWVGNDGSVDNLCDPVIGLLAELLATKGQTTAGTNLTELDACNYANAIYMAFSKVFKDWGWYKDKTLDYIHPDVLNDEIEKEFKDTPKPEDIGNISVSISASLWNEIRSLMVRHFQQIALHGWQFERFENAWNQWLKSNAEIDWTEERLHERIQAILSANLTISAKEIDICQCATNILEQYGMVFYQWMNGNLAQGKGLDELDANPPEFNFNPTKLCINSSFKSDTDTTIKNFLKNRYSAYKKVSYRLHIVVNLLSELRNIYPSATLHDCDDGSDQNPVRLGSTALGNHRLKTSTS